MILETLRMESNFCGNCGRKLAANDSVCPQCGTPREPGAHSGTAVTFLPSTSPDEPTVVSSFQKRAEEQQVLPARHIEAKGQKRGHRRPRRLLTGIIVGLLLLAGGGVALFFLLPLFTSSPSPSITLDAVCHALQQHNYQEGYNHFSASFRQEVSEPVFTSYFTGTTSCTYTPPQQAGSTATTQLTTTYQSGRTAVDPLTLHLEESGDWLIQAAPTLSTPARTLTQACTALVQGQYHTAYALFSSTYQQTDSEQSFTASFQGGRHVVACSQAPASVVGSRAIALVTLQRADGSHEQDQLTLIQDETNHWKINTVEVYSH
jgi:hypothetical protein